MRVAVLGGGVSGLSAAWNLVEQGHEVTIFEADQSLGGLLSTFDFGGFQLERYYHFLCAGDDDFVDVTRRLGIADALRWTKPGTGFFYEGQSYPFSSPLDLLKFSPISFVDRVRFGCFALEARLRRKWEALDRLPARKWLIGRLGQRAYDVMWHPLLAMKFGASHEAISAAWLWHRVHRVARASGRMGYLKGGSALLLSALSTAFRDMGGTIRLGCPVERIRTHQGRVRGIELAGGEDFSCDHVVSTLPTQVLAGLLDTSSPQEAEYAAALRRIEYIGVACVVLKLKKRVCPWFWLNVNDSRVPFNGIIEYTNLNPIASDAGTIAYIPYYLDTNLPLYQAPNEEIVEKSWRGLRIVAPHIQDDDLMQARVFRDPFAQAVCPVNFQNIKPAMNSPIHGLSILDSTLLYPEDRTQSGLMRCAKQCAEMIGSSPDA